MTIFKRIIDREIPAQIVYEDEHCLAFRDIHPQAPTHILLIPKLEIRDLDAAQPEHKALLGQLFLSAAEVARKVGLVERGYRIVVNNGVDGGQTVPHLHLHILGGREMKWPPG